MALAGSDWRGEGARPLSDAILPTNFAMFSGRTNWCAEVEAVAGGAALGKQTEDTRYWYGNKAALAIGLRRLSVFEYHRLLLFAGYGAWALLAAALAALCWRALLVGAPAMIFGVWLSGWGYWADAANGPVYVWAVLSAAILALSLRWRASARFAPVFCFGAGMASAYLWFADGHNAATIFLMGLAAWLGYSRLNGGEVKARRAAGCLALWVLSVAACFALMLEVRGEAAERVENRMDVSRIFFGKVEYRLNQAWAETPIGGGGSPRLGCPSCEGAEAGWRNMPIARDVLSLWIMTPLREATDRAILSFSVAACVLAAAVAAWRAWRGDWKPAAGVLWVAGLTALASVQFFLPTDVDFRNARFAFVPLAAGWVGLALAAAESGRRLAWVAPAALALFAVDGAALAHPLHAAALEREMAGERPAARSEFNVYLMEESGRILYRREDCSESDAAAEFFLIVFPANVNDLPERMRESGAERLNFGGPFHFYREGDWEPVSPHDGRCAMERDLPGYPISEIRTGQFVPGEGELWGVTLAGDMRVPDGEPTSTGGIFDLHWDVDRLIYAASDCSESDTRERFFLSIIPEDAANLSERSKARGLDHNSFNFDFKRRGAVWDDGECAAVTALPRYGIDAVETGQFVPGEGELWKVRMEVGD